MILATATHRASRLVASLALALAIVPAPGALAAAPRAGGASSPAVSSVAVVRPVDGTGRVDAQAPGPYRVNLARDGDYVRQANFVQCVGASVQMMLNITVPGSDRTTRTQHRLQLQARSWSGPRPDGRIRQGAGIFGWAAALNLNGGGPYGVVAADTLGDAMRVAAVAIVEQRRPVGLLVWRGRHAWVMSGFEATGDPRRSGTRITKAFILDPLYPHGSKVWGPSPVPGTPVSVHAVGRQFVPRRSGGRWNALPGMASLGGKYVLVVPTGAAPARLDKADPSTLLVQPFDGSATPEPVIHRAPTPSTPATSARRPQPRWPLGQHPF